MAESKSLASTIVEPPRRIGEGIVDDDRFSEASLKLKVDSDHHADRAGDNYARSHAIASSLTALKLDGDGAVRTFYAASRHALLDKAPSFDPARVATLRRDFREIMLADACWLTAVRIGSVEIPTAARALWRRGRGTNSCALPSICA